MSPHTVAALVLLAVFVLGTVRPVNVGGIGLLAAILAGPLVLGLKVKDVLAGFPADLFVLILGVTYLFSIATVNGTIEWVVNGCARLVGNRRPVLPIMLFAVSAVPTSLGAIGPAAVAMLAPIGLRLAQRYAVAAPLAGLMVVFGSSAGNFSPLNPLGVIVNGSVAKVGLPTGPGYLYLVSFVISVVMGVAVYVLGGGLTLVRETRARTPELATSAIPVRGTATGVAAQGRTPAGEDTERPEDVVQAGRPHGAGAGATPEPRADPPRQGRRARSTQFVTLGALIAVAVLALGFGLDVGTCALAAAVLLNLALASSSAGATKLISWNVVLLICGIVTYVQMMQRSGTLDVLGNSLKSIGSPMLAIVLICAVGALSSAFASSAGILGAMIPLIVPVIAVSGAHAVPIVTALAICVTLVDAAPFSSVGALVTTNTAEAERAVMHATLLRWCAAMIVVGPVLTGLALVLPAFA